VGMTVSHGARAARVGEAATRSPTLALAWPLASSPPPEWVAQDTFAQLLSRDCGGLMQRLRWGLK